MLNLIAGVILMALGLANICLGAYEMGRGKPMNLQLGSDLPNGQYVMEADIDKIEFKQNGVVHKTYKADKVK